MKTLKEKKVKKLVKGFNILKSKELLQIRGGDDGDPTQRDSDFD